MRSRFPMDEPDQHGTERDYARGSREPLPGADLDDPTVNWSERESGRPHPEVAEEAIELREEELVVHKTIQDVGEAVIRTVTEEIPGRMEVDAFREEVQVEHVPVGEVVRERREPWEDGDVLVVPVYEEQLVVVKRLVLREELHIRRVSVTERQLFEDTLRRDRLVVEDPDGTGLVHEYFPEDEESGADHDGEGLLERVKRAIR